MSRLQTAALWLIALVLTAQVGVEHLRPLVVLAAYEEPFIDAAGRCHEALSNYHEIQSALERDDSLAALRLEKSASVGVMDCYERQDLRLTMLAGGVNANEINRLDLYATNTSDVGLNYFVEDLMDGL